MSRNNHFRNFVKTVFFVAFMIAFQASASVQTELLYGQSEDFWGTYHRLSDAQGDLSRIQSILTSKYGTYEQSLSSIHVTLTDWPLSKEIDFLKTLYFGFNTDAVAFGLVQNPVIPVLHADIIALESFRTGVNGSIEPWDMKTRFGIVGGAGIEKRVDASSTDLIEHFPTQNGTLTMIGFDQGFDKDVSISNRQFTLASTLDLHETFFHSTLSASESDANNLEPDFFAFRWKGKSTFDWAVRLPGFQESEIGLQGVIGPQPLPVEVLPRVWDYSHQLDPLSEWGTLFGLGGVLKGQLRGGYSIDWVFGFYAGYFGAGLKASSNRFALTLGSWGVEGSSAYQALGDRVWVAGLNMGF